MENNSHISSYNVASLSESECLKKCLFLNITISHVVSPHCLIFPFSALRFLSFSLIFIVFDKVLAIVFFPDILRYYNDGLKHCIYLYMELVKRIWYLSPMRAAKVQSRQNLRCSLIQAVSQAEPSDRKPDPWPLWMAGLTLSWLTRLSIWGCK